MIIARMMKSAALRKVGLMIVHDILNTQGKARANTNKYTVSLVKRGGKRKRCYALDKKASIVIKVDT